jgi:DNA-binding Lrp family transcriptional regulator
VSGLSLNWDPLPQGRRAVSQRIRLFYFPKEGLLKAIEVTLIQNEFIDEHLKHIEGAAVKVFLYVARYTYGDMDETRPVKKMEIAEKIGLSEKSVYNALKELTDRQLVVVVRNKGRGACNGYRINNARQILPGKNYPVNKGALHGSEEPLLFESPAPEQPTSAATPPPDKPARVVKKQPNKRTEEEHEVHDELWNLFERALGVKITGKSAPLEAKSIWELIDYMNNGNGWRKEIKAVVERFIEYCKNPPEGFEYLAKCLPLPHILISPRTWMKFSVPVEETSEPTIEDTRAYVAALRESGVIKCRKE